MEADIDSTLVPLIGKEEEEEEGEDNPLVDMEPREDTPILSQEQDGHNSSGSINHSAHSDGEEDPAEKLYNARSNMPNSTTNTQTMMHLLKANVGTGILALPIAMSNAGVWVGLVGIIIMGIICTHCMHLLVKSAHALCRRLGESSLTYGQVVEKAFATGPLRVRKLTNAAKVMLNIFVCMTQYGFCCVYITFVGNSVQIVVESQWPDFTLPVQVYQLIAMFLILPFVYIRTLKHLSWVSMISNIISVIGLVIILQYCIRFLRPINSLPAFSSWAKLPLYFGTAVYAFEGIGVVLPLENRMKYPRDFPGLTGVLNTGMVTVTCLYTAVGFYGYLMAGPNVKGSITLNLPTDNWFYLSVILLFALAIMLTFPIQFFVAHNITWTVLSKYVSTSRQCLFENLYKLGAVIIIFILAAVIPHLDLMISLIGALASTAIALIFPSLLEILVFWPTGEIHWIIVVKDVLILIFAFIGFIAGTATAIYNIIQTF